MYARAPTDGSRKDHMFTVEVAGMNKAGFNERKLEILILVNDGLQTSREVADTCGISLSCASALLSRYWRQSLLRRYTDTRFNQKIYSLSDKGLKRINLLIRKSEVT